MRYATTTLAAVLTAGLLAAADKPAEKPPWQWLLRGDDAKLAAALTKRVDELREKDRYAVAVQAEEDLLALRRLAQGPDHYEAVTARWDLEALQRLAALPAEHCAVYRAALMGDTEALRLEA